MKNNELLLKSLRNWLVGANVDYDLCEDESCIKKCVREIVKNEEKFVKKYFPSVKRFTVDYDFIFDKERLLIVVSEKEMEEHDDTYEVYEVITKEYEDFVMIDEIIIFQ